MPNFLICASAFQGLSDKEIAATVIILFGLIGIINQIFRLVGNLKPHPPLHEQYVSRREFEQELMEIRTYIANVSKKVDRAFAEIKTDIRSMSQRDEKLHERISSLIETVAKHEGILSKSGRTP